MGSVLLVRHGETEWSASGKHTSTTDIPLTDAGRERAAELGPYLAGREFALVLTSPMSRARDTAGLAGFGDRAEVDEDLMEWRYGSTEGRTTAEIRVERPGWDIWNEGTDGETADEAGVRADRVIERVLGVDGDAIVFAHGHILRILGARWVGQPARFGGALALGTAAMCSLGWERERRVITRWNETGIPAAPGSSHH